MRRGLLSGAELVSVLGRFSAFTTATVVETPADHVERDGSPGDEPGEGCPRCGAVDWGMTPDGRAECTRCLWQEPAVTR